MSAPEAVQGAVRVEWHCETCLRHCVASKAHQRGCPHYSIGSAPWKKRALEEQLRNREKPAHLRVPEQRGLL